MILNAKGGHPGNDAEHAAVRRWTAPVSGTISIGGALRHPAKEGDGVRGRIVSSRAGVVGEWSVHHGSARTEIESIEVRAGDTLDFVVDCRSGPSHDSFEWIATLRLRGEGAEWVSEREFRGGSPVPLSGWGRLAQVLMLSNEFAFVD